MSTARKLAALVLAGAISGCATVGGTAARAPLPPAESAAEEALSLLELVEHINAVALSAGSAPSG